MGRHFLCGKMFIIDPAILDKPQIPTYIQVTAYLSKD